MTHFVLVHGGWHGAWCWSAVAGTLHRGGHEATAVQLPSDEVGIGAVGYADVIAEAVRPGGSVVVGHSLAGLAIPLVPQRANVTALVFLASLLPLPGRSWRDQLTSERPMADWFYSNALPRQGKDDQDRSVWPPDIARELFFADCNEDVAANAAAQLRPQSPTPVAESTPLTRLPHRRVALSDRPRRSGRLDRVGTESSSRTPGYFGYRDRRFA